MEQETPIPSSSQNGSHRKKKLKKGFRNRIGIPSRKIIVQAIVILLILALLGLVRWYGG